MNLYEIDLAIQRCFVDGEDVIDTETGEVLDAGYLDGLKMEKDKKIRNIACYIKNLEAEAEALKAEKMKMAARQKSAENKAESLKKYLSNFVGAGNKVKDTEYQISWRKSETVEIDDPSALIDDFLTFKAPEPNKTAIKQAIKNGDTVAGAHLVEKQNMQIK